MPAQTKRLVYVSVALLAFWTITTPIAIEQGWPAEFGGPGDPTNVGGEWISRGTLISAPLAPMLGQALFTILLFLRRRRWRVVAVLGLAVVGALYTIGGIGEPLDPEQSKPPAALYAALRVIGLAGSVALVMLGTMAVVREIRAER